MDDVQGGDLPTLHSEKLEDMVYQAFGKEYSLIPFRDYKLSEIIANKWEKIREKIDSLRNEEIMANDLEILADNIYQEFFIEPVEIYEEDFSKRSVEQEKIIQGFFDPYFGDYAEKGYAEVDGIIATFFFPFTGEKELFKCRASSISLGGYPEINISDNAIIFRIERSLNEMKTPSARDNLLRELQQSLESVKSGMEFANKDVRIFNRLLKSKSLEELQKKKKRVESYYSIANMLEVPIKKKKYAQTHIPLKRSIAPIAHNYEAANYYGITDADYTDILSCIKHTASTYERTPASYKAMQEEDLRNTLLAALNATYKGDATGETFRNAGKTDICIEKENRAAFVAECKIWVGQKGVQQAVEQLDSYLTWRDCKTALVYFVKRKDFLRTLESAEGALKNIEGMKNVQPVDKNEFKCLFLS